MFERSSILNHILELTKDNRLQWTYEDSRWVTRINESGPEVRISVSFKESFAVIELQRGMEKENLSTDSISYIVELQEAIRKEDTKRNKKLLKNVLGDLKKRSRG